MDYKLFFKSRQGEMVQLLKTLVHLESPTSDKKAVDACADFALREFRRSGAKVSTFPQREIGDLHLVDLPGPAEADGRILVLTHIDTVWPVGTIVKMPFYVSGPKIFGPGALDMKGGLVAAVFALDTIRRLDLRPRRRISVFVNSAEETGHRAAAEIILKLARKSDLILCLEPALPGGALKLRRKGRAVVRLETTGKAAHAGSPEKGINAIDELIGQIARLRRIRAREMTMSLGQIGGGDRPNVVAPSAWAVLDVRYWASRDKDRLLAALQDLSPILRGAKTKFQLQSANPPLERTPEQSALFARAKAVAAELGLSLRSGKTGGGSDASVAASAGRPALDGLGPDGDGLHAEHEHLLLPSLVERTALLVELLTRL